MNILSLFDGMSCGQIALNRCGIKYDNYYASEIDKYAIKVTQANYPNTIQLGDVKNVYVSMLPKIDLLIGGSPCQGFSFAGKGLNFEDERSKLFFEYVRLWKELQPKYFLLENVKMKKEHEQVISNLLGTQPIRLNSSLVSAQNRQRLYWTNIPVNSLLVDKGVMLKDIIESDSEHKYLSEKALLGVAHRLERSAQKGNGFRTEYISMEGKFLNLDANYFKGADGKRSMMTDNKGIRLASPIECERLQTVPDNYTNHVSSTQRYKMLGNGWAVDIICHIFSFMKQ